MSRIWRNSDFIRLTAALAAIGAALLLLATTPAGGSAPRAPHGLSAPTNLACLPFPQPTITEYNGDKTTGPFTSDATQTTVTWRDESDSETAYLVQRRVTDGDWVEIADLPPDTVIYTDTGLPEVSSYFYRVGAQQGGTIMWRESCRKPAFLDSSEGNFRIFYRPYSDTIFECPDIEDLDGDVLGMCSTQETAQRMADTLEASYAWLTTEWIEDITFPDPASSPPIVVDLTLCDGNGCARTDNGVRFIALKPSSMAVPYDLAAGSGEHSLRVPRHELFHHAQQGVTAGGDGDWLIEGTARSTDDKYCLDQPACDLTLDSYPGSWYTGDAADFLANPNRTLFETGYDAALFWSYISEQYGALTEEPERGIDFFVQFWASGQANAHTHGRQVIDYTLDDLGHDETFEDVFKDFVVANYAKDIPFAPAKYQYIDESQTPGSYGSVDLTVSEPLSVGEQFILGDEYDGDYAVNFVTSWGARYFRFTPDSGVPTLDIASESFTGNNLYYTLLAVKNGSIVEEINVTGSAFAEAIANDDLDEVVLIVAGLEESSNFSLAVNATQPQLRIADPLTSRPAQAGDPATPEKIFVKIEVLSPEGGGTPIAGIDPASFEITVGGDVVAAEDVITSAYIQGEYWLLVRAPDKAAPGSYDLTVENSTIVFGSPLSDTEPDAVVYDAALESDNLIVGDRSGSMNDFEGKLEAAQDAARLYVDSWESGDQLGVISYNEAATVDLGLQPWTTGSRDNAFDEIDAWVADGDTGIGNALLLGLEEFDDEGDTAHPWNMILLSDGMETVDDPNLQDFVDEYSARIDDSDPVPIVYVVALGPDADQAAMQQLACDTGDCDNYQYAGEPAGGMPNLLADALLNNELAEIYRVVAESVSLEQQIYAAHDTLLPLQEHSHNIQVDGSASEAIFVVNYVQEGETETQIRLRNPDGVLVSPTLIDGGGHFFYRVPAPMQGEWEVTLAYEPPGLLGPTAEELHYLVEASLRGDLTLDLFLGLPPEERLTGTPMPILVSLSDTQPLPGASVTAEVTAPSGAVYDLTFYDDGQHGDGDAGDGFYGATFYQTSQPGSYQLVVDGEGTSPLHGDFTRRARTSFYMDGGQDSDGDGLPRHWEEENGLDPHSYDPTSSDPDGDGLYTLTEFMIGTHPLDADTDNGGESDGSEYLAGRIPQDYPADDSIQPPEVVGWAGAGQLWLTFNNPPAASGYNTWRSNFGKVGPYVQVADNVPPALMWRDGDVSNGTEYCYRLVAVRASGAESGSTDVVCVTPRLDPIAPEGNVVISGDRPRTVYTTVQLALWASDAPSDRHVEHEGMPPVEEGTRISGVTQMMIANGRDFAGARWEPYHPDKVWTLVPDGRNVATVCVKFRDAAGNVSEHSCESIRISEPTVHLPIMRR